MTTGSSLEIFPIEFWSVPTTRPSICSESVLAVLMQATVCHRPSSSADPSLFCFLGCVSLMGYGVGVYSMQPSSCPSAGVGE